MKILDRYLGRVVLSHALVALLVLVAMSGFFSYVARLDDLTPDYGALEALWHTVLTLPGWAYDLMPTAVLIGALMGLGHLAAGSELVVLRASGMSVARVAAPVLAAGLVLALIGVVLGELVAPPAERQAAGLQARTRGTSPAQKTSEGFWARDGRDFVSIAHVLADSRLQGVRIFRYGPDGRLQALIAARSARWRDGAWWLEQVRITELGEDGVRARSHAGMAWKSGLHPRLLGVLQVDPRALQVAALWRFIAYLEENGLDSARYRLTFWARVVAPLATLVMLLVALPFVFGPLRSAHAGVRLVAGVLVGLAFYLANKTAANVGLLYGLPPLLSALAPSLVFLAGTLAALRWRG